MKKILILSMILSAITSFAQTKKLPLEYSLYIGAHYNSSFSNINKELKLTNLSEVPNIAFQEGAQIGYRFKNITLGINADFTYAKKNNISLKSSTTTVYISTNTLRSKSWVFSPQLGFGPKFSNLTIAKNNLTGTFQEFLTTKSNQTVLDHTTSVLDLGIVFKKINSNNSSLSPILKIGYVTGLDHTQWKIQNNAASHSPEDKTGNFYAQLILGLRN